MTPDDHDAVVDLVLRRNPSLPRAVVNDTVRDASTTESRRMLSAVEGGRLLGCGLAGRPVAAPPGNGFENVTVEPDAEGRGIGSALRRRLLAEPLEGVRVHQAEVDAGATRALVIAGHWGFEHTQVSVTSRVDLAGATRPELPPDVTVHVCPDLVVDDEEAVEAMLDASQTNPERFTGGALTLANLRALSREGGASAPAALVLRVDGRPAAITHALVKEGEAHFVYTGVDPRFRGRGLALLAKRAVHAELAANGVRTAVTNNEEANLGIRAVNGTLGYRRTDAVVFLRRAVATG